MAPICRPLSAPHMERITDAATSSIRTSRLFRIPIRLASNIPANTCSSYPQEPTKKNSPALPATNLWSGTQALMGNVQICGDLQLTGNVVVNAPSNAVLIIENGQLDTNGYSITTASGSGLTVVFSGTNSGSYTHAPTGGGT